MNRFAKTVVTAIVGLGAGYISVADLHACGGSGGGRPGGYGGYAYRPRPTYPQYAYPPAYQGPPQTACGHEPLPPMVRRMAKVRTSVPTQPLASQRQLPPQSRIAGQGVAQSEAPLRSPGRPPSTVNVGPEVQRQTTGALQSLGGLQALGSGQSQASQVAQGEPKRRPLRAQVAQAPRATPSQQTPPMGEAQLSAIQALDGLDDLQPRQTDEAEQIQQAESVDAAAPGGSPSQPSGYVGQWKASLGNGATVQLTLSPDGTFRWNAVSGGKSSSFEGQYTLSGGSLTLVRSSDNQKLAGSLTSAGSNAFNFKLRGAKDAGLNFSRG